jgi:hypothetical protein
VATESKNLPILTAALVLSFGVVVAFGAVWGPDAEGQPPGEPVPTTSAPPQTTLPPDPPKIREDPDETDESESDGSTSGRVHVTVGEEEPDGQQDFSVEIRTERPQEDEDSLQVCVRVRGWLFADSPDWSDATDEDAFRCREFSGGSLVIQGRQS